MSELLRHHAQVRRFTHGRSDRTTTWQLPPHGLLGPGGFAEVYLAEHFYLSTQAAIKLLLQLAQDEIRMPSVEARTIARLMHPHIVQRLGLRVEGEPLSWSWTMPPMARYANDIPKGLRECRFPPFCYVKQVASALQYAHDERLVHRDIKPENLLVGRDRRSCLVTLALRPIAHGTPSQNVETMAGTIPYMAPEQIQGHPRPASDQYSPGVVVYEWLCGDRPFHGTLTEVVVQHATMPPPPLQEKVPTISLDVEQVVMTRSLKAPSSALAVCWRLRPRLSRQARSNSPNQ